MGSAVIAVPASQLRRRDGVNAAQRFQPLLPLCAGAKTASGQKLLRGTPWGDGHGLSRGRKVLVVVGQEQGSVWPCPAGAQCRQRAVLSAKQSSCRDKGSEVGCGLSLALSRHLSVSFSKGIYCSAKCIFNFLFFFTGEAERERGGQCWCQAFGLLHQPRGSRAQGVAAGGRAPGLGMPTSFPRVHS